MTILAKPIFAGKNYFTESHKNYTNSRLNTSVKVAFSTNENLYTWQQ